MPQPPEIDTTNDHLVGMQNDMVSMVLPPLAPMTVDEAIRMAAWVVAICEMMTPMAKQNFEATYAAILNT